jgi:hypothetical protein
MAPYNGVQFRAFTLYRGNFRLGDHFDVRQSFDAIHEIARHRRRQLGSTHEEPNLRPIIAIPADEWVVHTICTRNGRILHGLLRDYLDIRLPRLGLLLMAFSGLFGNRRTTFNDCGQMTLLKDSDRVVTGRLSSIDVKNFSSDETRRVEIQYCIHDFRYFSHATHRMERGKERMDFGRVHGGLDNSR